MKPERVGRFELIVGWQRELQRLRSQNEATGHIERFLARLERLDGDTVADMALDWSRSQGDRRPLWFLSLLVTTLLAGLLAFLCLGVGPALVIGLLVAVLGTYQVQLHWESEQEFTGELYLRAGHVMNHPVWTR